MNNDIQTALIEAAARKEQAQQNYSEARRRWEQSIALGDIVKGPGDQPYTVTEFIKENGRIQVLTLLRLERDPMVSDPTQSCRVMDIYPWTPTDQERRTRSKRWEAVRTQLNQIYTDRKDPKLLERLEEALQGTSAYVGIEAERDLCVGYLEEIAKLLGQPKTGAWDTFMQQIRTAIRELQERRNQINLNDQVRVQLTKRGRAIWREWSSGYDTTQIEASLWEFIGVFGPVAGAWHTGADPVCKMDLELVQPGVPGGSDSPSSSGPSRS